MRLSPSNAKTERTTGIVLTLAGLAVNVSGAAALAGNTPSLNDEFGVGVNRFAPGGVTSGAGVGPWAYGDVEVRRSEGTAWMLIAEHRSERGHALEILGIVVTTLGLAFAAASFIPLGVPAHCQNRSNEDWCGLENFIAATAPGSTSWG